MIANGCLKLLPTSEIKEYKKKYINWRFGYDYERYIFQ